MPEPNDRRKWAINKSISLEAILALIGMLIGGIAYILHQDTINVEFKKELAYLHDSDLRHEESMKEIKQDIKQQLDRLEQKFDKFLERKR